MSRFLTNVAALAPTGFVADGFTTSSLSWSAGGTSLIAQILGTPSLYLQANALGVGAAPVYGTGSGTTQSAWHVLQATSAAVDGLASTATGFYDGLTYHEGTTAQFGPMANNVLANWKLKGGTTTWTLPANVTINGGSDDFCFQPTLGQARRRSAFGTVFRTSVIGVYTISVEFVDPGASSALALIPSGTVFSKFVPYAVFRNAGYIPTNIKVEAQSYGGSYSTIFDAAPTLLYTSVWRSGAVYAPAGGVAIEKLKFTFTVNLSTAGVDTMQILELGFSDNFAIQGSNMFGLLNGSNTWNQPQLMNSTLGVVGLITATAGLTSLAGTVSAATLKTTGVLSAGFLATDASGNIVAGGGGGANAPITGSGTPNVVPLFTSARVLGDSGITDTGSLIGFSRAIVGTSASFNILVNAQAFSIGGIRSAAYLATDVNGNIIAGTGVPVVGPGTANYVAKWTGASTQGNSVIQDTGYLGVNVAPSNAYGLYVSFSTNLNAVARGTAYGIRSDYTEDEAAGSEAASAYRTALALSFIKTGTAAKTTGWHGSLWTNDVAAGGSTVNWFGVSNRFSTRSGASVSTLYQFVAERGYYSGAVGTVADRYAFVAMDMAAADATVTNSQRGFHAADLTQGTARIGFSGSLSAGTGKWNLYFGGSAQNWMAGALGIGAAKSVPTQALDVAGNIAFTGSVTKGYQDISVDATTYNGQWIRVVQTGGSSSVQAAGVLLAHLRLRFTITPNSGQSNRGNTAVVEVFSSPYGAGPTIQVLPFIYGTAVVTQIRTSKDTGTNNYYVDVYIENILAGKTESLRVELIDGPASLVNVLSPVVGTQPQTMDLTKPGITGGSSLAWNVLGSVGISSTLAVTGTTAFTGDPTISSSRPEFNWITSIGAAGSKRWSFVAGLGAFFGRAYDEANANNYSDWVQVDRTGYSVSNVTLKGTGQPYWSNYTTSYKIWHAGNQGALSGLDADLLDGQHGAYYQARANHTGTQPWSTISPKPVDLADLGGTGYIQPLDSDLTAIAALTGTGYARRTTAAPTWDVVPTISWGDISGAPGFSTGAGTANYVARWTATGGALGDSVIQDNGTTIGIRTAPSASSALHSVMTSTLGGPALTNVYANWFSLVENEAAGSEATTGERIAVLVGFAKNGTGASVTAAFGVLASDSIVSGSMPVYRAFASRVGITAPASVVDLVHFSATNSGSTGAGFVTNRYGFSFANVPTTEMVISGIHYAFYSASLTQGATRYSFYSAMAASGNIAWAFYAGGNALNYFLGNVGIGTGKTVPTVALDVAGAGSFTGDVTVNGGVYVSSLAPRISLYETDSGADLKRTDFLYTTSSLRGYFYTDVGVSGTPWLQVDRASNQATNVAFNGTGNLLWNGKSVSTAFAAGTVNALPRWQNTTGAMQDSGLSDDGTTVSTARVISSTGLRTLLMTPFAGGLSFVQMPPLGTAGGMPNPTYRPTPRFISRNQATTVGYDEIGAWDHLPTLTLALREYTGVTVLPNQLSNIMAEWVLRGGTTTVTCDRTFSLSGAGVQMLIARMDTGPFNVSDTPSTIRTRSFGTITFMEGNATVPTATVTISQATTGMLFTSATGNSNYVAYLALQEYLPAAVANLSVTVTLDDNSTMVVANHAAAFQDGTWRSAPFRIVAGRWIKKLDWVILINNTSTSPNGAVRVYELGISSSTAMPAFGYATWRSPNYFQEAQTMASTLAVAGTAAFASNITVLSTSYLAGYLTNDAGFLVTAGSGVIRNAGNAVSLYIDSASGLSATVRFRSDQALYPARWVVGKNSTADSGSNVGSDFVISRYNDAGAILDTAVQITRSNGEMVLGVLNGVANPGWKVTTGIGTAGSLFVNGPLGFSTGTGAIQFWGGSPNYSIQMKAVAGDTVAGTPTSDYNMYFRMTSGQRGYVFQMTDPVLTTVQSIIQLAPTGVYTPDVILGNVKSQQLLMTDSAGKIGGTSLAALNIPYYGTAAPGFVAIWTSSGVLGTGALRDNGQYASIGGAVASTYLFQAAFKTSSYSVARANAYTGLFQFFDDEVAGAEVANTGRAALRLEYTKTGTGAITVGQVFGLYSLSTVSAGTVSNLQGINNRFSVASGASATANYAFVSEGQYATGPGGTLGTRYGFYAGDLAATDAVITSAQYGFYCANLTQGSASVLSISYASAHNGLSGSGHWGLYFTGTAANYLNGGLMIGAATLPFTSNRGWLMVEGKIISLYAAEVGNAGNTGTVGLSAGDAKNPGYVNFYTPYSGVDGSGNGTDTTITRRGYIGYQSGIVKRLLLSAENGWSWQVTGDIYLTWDVYLKSALANAAYLSTDALGRVVAGTWATAGVPIGAGTSGYVTRWTGTNTVGNSVIQDNGYVALFNTPNSNNGLGVYWSTRYNGIARSNTYGINLSFTDDEPAGSEQANVVRAGLSIAYNKTGDGVRGAYSIGCIYTQDVVTAGSVATLYGVSHRITTKPGAAITGTVTQFIADRGYGVSGGTVNNRTAFGAGDFAVGDGTLTGTQYGFQVVNLTQGGIRAGFSSAQNYGTGGTYESWGIQVTGNAPNWFAGTLWLGAKPTLPASAPTAGSMTMTGDLTISSVKSALYLATDANGKIIATAGGGGGGGNVTGTGTAAKIPKWATTASLTDSSLTDNGTTVTSSVPLIGSRLAALDVLNAQVLGTDGSGYLVASSAITTLNYRYVFAVGITAPPNPGTVRLDSSTMASVANMFIDKTSNDSAAMTTMLLAIKPGDAIYIQDRSNTTAWLRFVVTGAPTDTGGTLSYVLVPVKWVSGSTLPVNGIVCSLILMPASSGSGTTNRLSRWSASGFMDASNVTDDGNVLTLGLDTTIQGGLKLLGAISAPLLKTDALGNVSGTTIAAAGGLTGSGTANYVAKWTSASAQTSSVLQDNGYLGVFTTPLNAYGLVLAFATNANAVVRGSAYGMYSSYTEDEMAGSEASNAYRGALALNFNKTGTAVKTTGWHGSLWITDTASAGSTSSWFGVSNRFSTRSGATVTTLFQFVAERGYYGGAVGTVTDRYAFVAADMTTGDATVTNSQHGFYVSDFTQGTLRAGFQGVLTAGTGKWNVYMSGNAQNWLGGPLGIGSGKSVPAYDVDAAGTVSGNNLRAASLISAQVVGTDATGMLISTSAIGGSGVVNTVPRFATTTSLTNSAFRDDGSSCYSDRPLSISTVAGVVRQVLGFSISASTPTASLYYKIAALPLTNADTGNGSCLDIDMTCGLTNSTTFAQLRVMVSNRSSDRVTCQMFGNSRQTNVGIRVYKEADTTLSVYAYLDTASYKSFTVSYRNASWGTGTGGVTMYSAPANVAAPTGSVIFDSATAVLDLSVLGTTAASAVGLLGGNKIWHAGNQGALSGLDADLLDGQHGAYYLSLGNTTGTLPVGQITGLALIATSGSATDLTSGSVPAARFANLTVPIAAINASGTASATTMLTGTGWQTFNSGVITGVAATAVSPLTVSVTGSPSVTLTFAWAATTAAAQVFAGPTGAAGAPTYRILAAADIPPLAWSTLTGKPTTLAGYGITDAQPLDADLTAIAALATTGYLSRTGTNTWAVATTIPWSDLTGYPGYGTGTNNKLSKWASGKLADSNVTDDGTTVSIASTYTTVKNYLSVGGSAGVEPLSLVDPLAGQVGGFYWRRAGAERWRMIEDASTESGNDGSNLVVQRYVGSVWNRVYTIKRLDGTVDFNSSPTVGGSYVLVGNAASAGYLPKYTATGLTQSLISDDGLSTATCWGHFTAYNVLTLNHTSGAGPVFSLSSALSTYPGYNFVDSATGFGRWSISVAAGTGANPGRLGIQSYDAQTGAVAGSPLAIDVARTGGAGTVQSPYTYVHSIYLYDNVAVSGTLSANGNLYGTTIQASQGLIGSTLSVTGVAQCDYLQTYRTSDGGIDDTLGNGVFDFRGGQNVSLIHCNYLGRLELVNWSAGNGGLCFGVAGMATPGATDWLTLSHDKESWASVDTGIRQFSFYNAWTSTAQYPSRIVLRVSSAGDLMMGGAAEDGRILPTSATAGFFWMNTCAGTPSGVPVPNRSAGAAAMVYVPSLNTLMVYNGSWKAIDSFTQVLADARYVPLAGGVAMTGNLPFTSGDGLGVRFWGTADSYSFYMSQAVNATYGGSMAASGQDPSAYNIYTRMSGPTTRGFVWSNGTTPVAQLVCDGSFFLPQYSFSADGTLLLTSTNVNTGGIFFGVTGGAQPISSTYMAHRYVKDLVAGAPADMYQWSVNMSPSPDALSVPFSVTNYGDVMMRNTGNGPLANTATTGFFWIRTILGGMPTGIPTPARNSAIAAMVFSRTDNKVYVYNAGWQAIGGTGGVGPQGPPGPAGPVNSVGLTMPADFTVSNSPLVGPGVLGVVWTSQTGRKFMASPTSGSGTPTFRILDSGDFPAKVVPVGALNSTATPAATTFYRGDGDWKPVDTMALVAGTPILSLTSSVLVQLATNAALYVFDNTQAVNTAPNVKALVCKGYIDTVTATILATAANASNLTSGTLPIARIGDGTLTPVKLQATGNATDTLFYNHAGRWTIPAVLKGDTLQATTAVPSGAAAAVIQVNDDATPTPNSITTVSLASGVKVLRAIGATETPLADESSVDSFNNRTLVTKRYVDSKVMVKNGVIYYYLKVMYPNGLNVNRAALGNSQRASISVTLPFFPSEFICGFVRWSQNFADPRNGGNLWDPNAWVTYIGDPVDQSFNVTVLNNSGVNVTLPAGTTCWITIWDPATTPNSVHLVDQTIAGPTVELLSPATVTFEDGSTPDDAKNMSPEEQDRMAQASKPTSKKTK